MNKNIKIQGMSCAGCAKRLQDEMSLQKGVINANVNFANETLFIEYDTQLNINELFKTIEKLGFKVIEEDQNKEVIIGIGGMSCTSCAQGIEKQLIKKDGIEKIEVNFATEKAKIIYNNKISKIVILFL